MAKAKLRSRSSPQGSDSFTDILQRPLDSESQLVINASLPFFDRAFVLDIFWEIDKAEGRKQLTTIIIPT